MKTQLLTAICLAAVSAGAWAQPAVPPVIPAAPSQSVSVSNKCCSIWDFLGVGQLGNFVSNQICKTSLFTGVNTLLSPLARALGLGPSLLSDKFAKEGGAMGLASQLKKEEKKVPLKVKAIRYLATLDCKCYPDIVPTLLESLDDCSEKVRFEALKALDNNCGKGKCCDKIKAKLGHGEKCADGACDMCTNGDCPPCDCPGCQCDKAVLEKLNKMLLARDEFGCLKEKSQRIRRLATEMIEECLVMHQPHPDLLAPAAVADPVPDEPRAVPDEPSPPASDAPSTNRLDIRKTLPSFFGGQQTGEKPATITEPASHRERITGDSAAKPHVVRYQSIPSAKTSKTEVHHGEVIMSQPHRSASGKRSERRHLMGELFGY